jgi:hypothetical protein
MKLFWPEACHHVVHVLCKLMTWGDNFGQLIVYIGMRKPIIGHVMITDHVAVAARSNIRTCSLVGEKTKLKHKNWYLPAPALACKSSKDVSMASLTSWAGKRPQSKALWNSDTIVHLSNYK